jgi:hypothetical protein
MQTEGKAAVRESEEEHAEAEDGGDLEHNAGLGGESSGCTRGERGVVHAVDRVEEEVEDVRVGQEEGADLEGR